MNETITITIDDEARQKTSLAMQVLQEVESVKIDTNLQYKNAGTFLKKIKSVAYEIECIRKSITGPLDSTKKMVMEYFQPAQNDLKNAEGILKAAMLNFQENQEKLRKIEQEKLNDQIAEVERKQKEAMERRAKMAELKGNEEKAELLRSEASGLYLQRVEVQNHITKISGVKTIRKWDYEIVDIKKVPREYLKINEELLSQIARSTKGMLEIEGVRFFEKQIMSSGRD